MIRDLNSYRRGQLILLAVFICSRVAYFAAGLRFNLAPLTEFWQMVDLQLLKTDLSRSIWYLHMQPPGFNLLIGILLKLFPVHFAGALWGIQILCGVAIMLSLFQLTAWLGIPRALGLGLTIFFVISPSALLYEDAAFYDYPVNALLLGSATALTKLIDKPTRGTVLLFFGSLAALAFIRNLFHILYLLIILAAALVVFSRHRKLVLVGALPPLLFVGAIYVKNGIVFGRYTASTWGGMQIARVTVSELTREEAGDFIAEGVISPMAKVETFGPLKWYLPYLTQPQPETGIPVLDNPVTSTGASNFNDLAYLEVHDRYAADAKQVLLHRPQAWVRALESAWFCYFRPPSDLEFYFGAEARPISNWERLFAAVFYGQFHRSENHEEVKELFRSGHVFSALAYTGVWLVLLLPVLVVWSLWRLFSRSGARQWTPDQKILVGYLLLTILVLSLTVNALSFSENNRYRFGLDPFFLILFGLAVKDIIPQKGERGQAALSTVN